MVKLIFTKNEEHQMRVNISFTRLNMQCLTII